MANEPQDLVHIDSVPEGPEINTLLPVTDTSELTVQERARMEQFQMALSTIGQAAGGALICPGNQVGVSEVNQCPYAAKCELLRVQKAPQGELCPIERDFLVSKFNGWCSTIGANPRALKEDQRAVVSELTWIDVQ